jgi:adenosylcobyric acid synthase
MVQGTSSSVGKSLLTAALCRIFARRGVRVAPFKAQNMSNNAAVCADGCEIGRAQALQAAAAFIEPSADLNPILLKPEGQARSQVIVRGRLWQTLGARDFYKRKAELWSVVTAALDRLREEYELVIAEGAGSPVELNLRDGDIVNMAVARYAQASVLLVGDIDRGGVFAQILGTLWLLPPEERALVRGLVINKFRGDPGLFTDGVRLLEQRGSVPVLGIVPYLNDLILPEEDAVALDGRAGSVGRVMRRPPLRSQDEPRSPVFDLVIIRLPHIANFDDFDPLRAEPGVQIRYVDTASALGEPDAILLPGTKTTMADLAWLKAAGLDDAIRERATAGMAVAGICGGYQMLGCHIFDPYHVESSAEATTGLGLLPVETTFARTKSTHQVRARITGGPGWLADLAGTEISGYEIHAGTTVRETSWLEIIERSGREVGVSDGAVAGAGRVWGCYVHGLFANDLFRQAWLGSLRGTQIPQLVTPQQVSLDGELERLADAVHATLDMNRLDELCYGPQTTDEEL